MRRIPLAGEKISIPDILSQAPKIFAPGETQAELAKSLALGLGKKHVFLVNSGLSAFYLVLKTLKACSAKTEVVLPAYTAASLIVAVRKAGLRPVLCDISLEDFNLAEEELPRAVTPQTLCIVGVHMFGIVAEGLKAVKARFPDVFLVEDGCQALGSRWQGQWVGRWGDLSFLSFNRGKNLPTYGGGCLATDDEKLARVIEATFQDLPRVGLDERLKILMKMLAFSLAVRPAVYGYLHSVLEGFRELAPPRDFDLWRYTDFQAGLALLQLKRSEASCQKRRDNGLHLAEGLSGQSGVRIPVIAAATDPAFTRFPILLDDLTRRDRIEDKLRLKGIETSRMYFRPLHHFFDLGYRLADFPNAVYLAQHLLTLPVHPLVEDRDLNTMIDVIRLTP